ncbi:MAG: AAA family ATPase, partial [Caulobacteraceae bacterium]|nr:AAA family ATPase [Caulobacteraceae bacterium]
VVIDTEEGSSDLYDTLHDFDVIDLKPPFTPERYIEAITAAEQAGYEVIIVDSVTHCWSGKGGCLELVDDIAKAQFRGNTWSAFSVITPRWRAFVDAILRSSAHVICTGRSKTETAQVEDGGRKKVTKLGMKLEARDGLEYEFTCVLDLIHDGHFATVSKDRTGLFTGDPKPITVDTGKRLAAWLAGAEPVAPPTPPKPAAAAPVADDRPLVEVIAESIAEAKSNGKLKNIIARLDELVVEGRIDGNQRSELTDAANTRLASIKGEVIGA